MLLLPGEPADHLCRRWCGATAVMCLVVLVVMGRFQLGQNGPIFTRPSQQPHKQVSGGADVPGNVTYDPLYGPGEMHRNWIIVPEHKLLFCFAQKVGCLAFNDLFRSLRSRYDPSQVNGTRIWRRNDMRAHGITLETMDAMVQDPTWHKAVFYREPLERFVSAFRSKCEPGHDADRHVCAATFGTQDPSFADAVARLSREPPITDRHWRAQSEMCGGLTKILGNFRTVERLDPRTAREKVAQLLSSVGVEPESVPAFNKQFPVWRPQRSAEQDGQRQQGQGQREGRRRTQGRVPQQVHHGTHAGAALGMYYTSPQLVCEVLRYYADDYLLFGIPVPQWVQRWDFHGDRWLAKQCKGLPP